MTRFRPLLMTAMLATFAFPGHASESARECPRPSNEADADTQACAAAAVRPQESATARADTLGLDCTLFVLGGLASGARAPGSQLASATIRHCSLRGYIFGVAWFRRPLTRDQAAG